MSDSNEEPYSTIFTSLKHPIRRRILRMLSKKPMSFSEMLEVLGVSSSFLTYHLENLGELVSKVNDGKYKLSSFGEAALSTLTKVEDIPTTSPQQSSQTRPKIIIGRSVAIALGIICIVLVAFIGGAIIYYNSVLNSKDKTISSQNSQVSNLINKNNQLQTWLDENESLLNQTLAWLNGNLTAYNQLQNEFTSIYYQLEDTENTTVLVDNQTLYVTPTRLPLGMNGSAVWSIPIEDLFLGPFLSAGYVAILFSSNSTSSVLSYTSGSLSIPANNFSNPEFLPLDLDNITQVSYDVGSTGMILFPVLPSTPYGIGFTGFSETVPTSYYFTLTIIYYY